MHILLTNDDGYFSSGITLLKKCLQRLGHRFTVVAPQPQNSAVSSALTLFEPIFLYENKQTKKMREYYISGSPVDCVKVALSQILKEKPDLLISGINQGANIGINVVYSGTVGAAFEGILNEIPSIALSFDSNDPQEFALMAPALGKFLKKLLTLDLGIDCVWNVNFPCIEAKKIQGIRFTQLSKAFYQDRYEHRKDLRGRSYFWLGSNTEIQMKQIDKESDAVALKKGYISISPITFTSTHKDRLKQVSPLDW